MIIDRTKTGLENLLNLIKLSNPNASVLDADDVTVSSFWKTWNDVGNTSAQMHGVESQGKGGYVLLTYDRALLADVMAAHPGKVELTSLATDATAFEEVCAKLMLLSEDAQFVEEIVKPNFIQYPEQVYNLTTVAEGSLIYEPTYAEVQVVWPSPAEPFHTFLHTTMSVPGFFNFT